MNNSNILELILSLISKVWSSFWLLWPKSSLVLILISAIAEVFSVTVFKFGGNRGGLAVLGYILGFLAVGFYAEGQKYSTLAISYPIWIGVVAILVSASAFFVFQEQISIKWFIGFVLTIVGVLLIQTSITKL